MWDEWINWWSSMDLAAWMGNAPQRSCDYPFAQALACERARVRGVRQRVTPTRVDGYLWQIADVT